MLKNRKEIKNIIVDTFGLKPKEEKHNIETAIDYIVDIAKGTSKMSEVKERLMRVLNINNNQEFSKVEKIINDIDKESKFL